MNRRAAIAAFGAGLAAIAWVAWGYVGSSALALLMTLLIGAFYMAGALELHRYERATATLRAVLADRSGPQPADAPDLPAWLQRLDSTLRPAVRLRIEGERHGLPGPAMTPYLVGLLVLLGMLGTFLGMVVTLNGAVMALESTTDLATIRAALAAPVKGLGLAFGTSVAGVAASAMLGLVSALCRRDRLQAGQALDAAIATWLHAHTPAFQRAATLAALQAQARLVPDVVAQVQDLVAQMHRHGESLNERLLAGQDRFHAGAQASYVQLASSVERSLKHSLVEGARAAGAALQPAVQASMAGIVRETAAFRQQLADAVQQQLDGVGAQLAATVATVSDTWRASLAGHQRSSESLADALRASLEAVVQTLGTQSQALVHTLGAHSDALVETMGRQSADVVQAVDRAHAALHARASARDEERLSTWTAKLDAVATNLQRDLQQAGAAAAAQQARICDALQATATAIHEQAAGHARATIEEMSRLIATASEAPRAAAEVVGELRQRLSESMVRDNGLLEERARILSTLDTLLAAVNHAATEQRGAVDALVASSSELLQRAGAQFDERITADAGRMAEAATLVAGSAVDIAGLGAAFGTAVQMFSTSSEALAVHLQRIEGTLEKSSARSDEQLAYYVAQAREIVDLSLSSQKQIVEDLQRLAARPAVLGEPA